MERTHFVHIHTFDTRDDDDQYFLLEVEDTQNPFDSDDAEVAYHEYLAQRFAMA